MHEFILQSPERMEIFKHLCESHGLSFSAIEKATGISSNKLSYQLNTMLDREFLEKTNGQYTLSKQAQRLIPYFSQLYKKEVGVLPVVLGIVRRGEKILLIKRRKMPYKGLWSVIGGKQIAGESIPETIEREIAEEADLEASFSHYNGLAYERVYEGDFCKHSMLLLVVTAQADSERLGPSDEGEVAWFDFQDVIAGKVEGIIPSDLEFIRRYHDKRISVDHVIMEESASGAKLTAWK